MDNLIPEAIYYISKISKKKVTVDSISTYLNNKGAHKIDNKSIIKTLNQLQGSSLNNQFCRPKDTAMLSKAPFSTPSQSLIPPIAEKHVNETSVNDTINKPIPSINRSLPATSVAKTNTTPCVLTIGNSSLNVKFESLKSKYVGNLLQRNRIS